MGKKQRIEELEETLEYVEGLSAAAELISDPILTLQRIRYVAGLCFGRMNPTPNYATDEGVSHGTETTNEHWGMASGKNRYTADEAETGETVRKIPTADEYILGLGQPHDTRGLIHAPGTCKECDYSPQLQALKFMGGDFSVTEEPTATSTAIDKLVDRHRLGLLTNYELAVELGKLHPKYIMTGTSWYTSTYNNTGDFRPNLFTNINTT